MDERIFAKAFEKASVGMSILDPKGLVLKANPALCNTLEKPLSVLNGGYLDDHMGAEDGRRWRQFYEEFVGGRATDHYFEALFLPSRPREAWWSIQLGDLETTFENQKVFFAVVQDITLKKAGEMRLKESRINAERASRAKSQFLANMSHEIRTPIHTITGMSELLLDSGLKEAQWDYARQISLSADILLSIIDDVLDFSKIEAGRMTMEAAPFDLHKILDQAVELVTLSAYKKGLDLGLFLEKNTPHLLVGDSHRLRQVLVNLMANAVKFTGKGEVVLSARCIREDEKTATLLLSVRDTGIGVSEIQSEHLFEAFYQADSSTTRKFGGTGLGLAICQRLVKMMGGEINMKSQVGVGSEFYFTVVLEKQATSDILSSVPREFFEGKPILVAEDNLTCLGITSGYLEEWGCQVTRCTTGEKALELLRTMNGERPYSLVILDQNLPDLDGWALAHKIRQDARLEKLYLILMTNFGNPLELAKKKVLKLYDAYIPKPIRRQDLVEAVFQGMNRETQMGIRPTVSLFQSLGQAVQEDGVKGKTVLVAEDNEVNRELFALLLGKMGYSVVMASNGEEAVQLFIEKQPIIIFMDLQMPEMNGFEAAAKIRKTGSTVPIIAVTASALKGEMERCLKVGMNDFITKPFKSPDLVEVIQRVLQDPGFKQHLETLTMDQPAQETAPNLEIFNLTEALEVFLGKREILVRLVKNFIPKTQEHIDRIHQAWETSDMERIFQGAHAVKGSAMNLTAKDLGAAAAALERAGRAGDRQGCQILIPSLEKAFERFKNAIGILLPSDETPKENL